MSDPQAKHNAYFDRSERSEQRPCDTSQSENSNIVMIGMPGAGKSTLGVVLAKILNKGFVDTDLVIQGACKKTLQEIIDEEGPEGFIAIENHILSQIEADNSVISTGGSAVYSPEAMAHLASIGTIVYLEISYESLVTRLGDLHERGVVLKDGLSMSLRELYDERRPLYEQFADITIPVDGQSITESARAIAKSLDVILAEPLERKQAN